MSELDKKDEYHVASFVAHALPKHISDVSTAITSTEGAEIHATSPEGKIIFTLEGPTQQSIGRKIDILKHHKGLSALSPVYHQYLAEDEPKDHLLATDAS
jgi:periplasmic nitrate reductase NapD